MHRLFRIVPILAAVALLLAIAAPFALASDESPVKATANPEFGQILTDAKGMTLYIFTKDKANESVCYGDCAVKWPPLMTTSDQITTPAGLGGTLGVIESCTDGTKQVTFNGQPLYYWVNDKQPGDTTGQNVGEVWFVIQVQAASALPKTGDMPTGTLAMLAAALLLAGGGVTYFARARAR